MAHRLDPAYRAVIRPMGQERAHEELWSLDLAWGGLNQFDTNFKEFQFLLHVYIYFLAR